jgi:hypothetical protein
MNVTVRAYRDHLGPQCARGLVGPQIEFYSERRLAVWGRNQEAPANGLWLAKSFGCKRLQE